MPRYSYHNDKLLYWSLTHKQCSGHVIIFFHGFPADSGKNEDLAQHLHKKLNVDTYLMHFAGLGKSKGKFSFKGAMDDALSFSRYVIGLRDYQRVTIIGHSFGGYVASHVANELKGVDNLIMLAPLVSIPPPEVAEMVIKEFMLERKGYSQSELRQDVESIRGVELGASSYRNIYILHGKHDIVIDPQLTRDFADSRSLLANYEELDTDHWFVNREELLRKVLDWLMKKTVK